MPRVGVVSYDNSTRGLDASTALDYAKSIRILTDITQMTTFVSIYQAGEGIYQQFDKVLVIDEGRQVYFGPTSEARQYFVNMGYRDHPRQTTADYLTGCTDPNERKYQEGRSEKDVPSTSEAMAEYYKNSKTFAKVQEDIAQWEARIAAENPVEDFKAAVIEGKGRGSSSRSKYTVSFMSQVKAIAVRHVQLKIQDWFTLATGLGTAVSIAIICGSLFLSIPKTSAGAFTRGGALFISLLFNAFNAFAELPTQMSMCSCVAFSSRWLLMFT